MSLWNKAVINWSPSFYCQSQSYPTLRPHRLQHTRLPCLQVLNHRVKKVISLFPFCNTYALKLYFSPKCYLIRFVFIQIRLNIISSLFGFRYFLTLFSIFIIYYILLISYFIIFSPNLLIHFFFIHFQNILLPFNSVPNKLKVFFFFKLEKKYQHWNFLTEKSFEIALILQICLGVNSHLDLPT